MDKAEIVSVVDPDDPVLQDIAGLFKSMYSFMKEQGLLLPMTEGGDKEWIDAIKGTLERFAVLLVARSEGQAIGFAHGGLKFSAGHQGNLTTGFISHVYVLPKCRRTGTATALLSGLEKWFANQKVHSIELMVLNNNTAAHSFWKNAGYISELVQYRKLMS